LKSLEKIQWYKLYNSEEEAKSRLSENNMRRVVADGRAICIVRTKSGFYAIDDECPHLGESLSKGTLNYLNEIICPWHSYRYHLKTGVECKGRGKALPTHILEFRADGVFLGIRT